MLGQKSGQIDIFNAMIYEKLIPKDHLLVKIAETIDFTFVYDIAKGHYSEVGRESVDPVIMFKLCLLEYLYCLSDRQVVARTHTDIAFRWFLGLNIDDKVPDDSTISYFRSIRMGDSPFESFFNTIVQKCIDSDLIKTKRFIVDSTDVAANVNYPKVKHLLCDAYRRMTRELNKLNTDLAESKLRAFEEEINTLKANNEEVSMNKYCLTARKYAEEIYIKTYDEFKDNKKYYDTFVTLWRIIEHYGENKTKTDRIISCIDPDARVGNKTKGNLKRGYKSHIIIDEESEIILASETTPFSEGDELHLKDMIDKVEENFNLKPAEVSADTVYGTTDNRAYLKDNEIISNINFRDFSNQEYEVFNIRMFDIAENLSSATCPNGCVSQDVHKSNGKNDEFVFKFSKDQCSNCPLFEQCVGSSRKKARVVRVSGRYDAVTRDLHRNQTQEYKEAANKRYIVERRFATLVRNHGLRRCRYLRQKGARIHITLANIACNIVRMVKLLGNKANPSFAMSKT
jgi:transposase